MLRTKFDLIQAESMMKQVNSNCGTKSEIIIEMKEECIKQMYEVTQG